MAKDVSARTGIPWQTILAVGANETGWGQFAKGNNFFGIKGKNPKTGASFQAGTWEEVNGQRQDITDEFRSYDNAEQSFQDFADFLHNNPRYQPALDYLQQNPGDWRTFTRMLQDEGYATGHAWSDQVISIGNGFPDDGAVQPSVLSQNNQAGGVSSVIDVGSTAIGSKYQWGGSGGRSNFNDVLASTDCSGFVSWAYEKATGIRLPAQTSAIYASTQAIRPEEAQPGDLIEFGMNQNDPEQQHVAIYAGNGMMLHDSSVNPNGGVDLTPIWQGGEFRRVPGVDPSLRSAGGKQGPNVSADDQWFVSSQGGRLVYQGITADGQGYTYDMGPTSAPENATLGGSFLQGQQQPQPQPQPQGGGNEVGAGAEAPSLSPLESAIRQIIDQAISARMGSGQEDGENDPSSAAPDPRVAPVVVQELHEINDPTQTNTPPGPDTAQAALTQANIHEARDSQQPLPGDAPAPAANTSTVPTAADVTNATNAGAQPAPTSGQDLARQFAMDRPLGAAPSVTAGTVTTSSAPVAGRTAAAAADVETGAAPPAPVTPPSMGTQVHIAPAPRPSQPQVDVPPPQPPPQQAPPTADEQAATTPPPPAVGPITRANLGTRAVGNQTQAGASARALTAGVVSTAEQVPGAVAHTASLVPGYLQNTVLPAAEGAAALASKVLPYLSTSTLAGQLMPGVQDSLDNLYRNGIDLGPALDKLTRVEPGSIQDRVIKGDKLNGADRIALGFDTLNRLNDFRSAAIRAAQAPDIRDTPSGQAFNWGATLVSDPLNMIGLPEAATGARLMEEGTGLLARGAERAAAGAISEDVGREAMATIEAAPRNIRPETAEYLNRLAAPVPLDQTQTVLQRAGLDLNDQVLLDNSRSLTGQVRTYDWPTDTYSGTTRFEPLTGRQLRDTVIRGVARQHPNWGGQQILDETDGVLRRAGRSDLTTGSMAQMTQHATDNMAFQQRVINNARKNWYTAPAEQAAAIAEQAHQAWWQAAARAAGTAVRQSSRIEGGDILPGIRESYYQPKPLALGPLTPKRALTGSALGALGFTRAYATSDPNDPNRWLKVGAATAGASLAGIGLAWGAGLLWRGLNGRSVNLVNEAFQPTENLSPFARQAITRLAGEQHAAGEIGRLFEDRTRSIFGNAIDHSFMIQVEETGKLPAEWRGNKAAEDWLNDYRAITSWAVQHDIVHHELLFLEPGGPAMYVPHPVAEDYKAAEELAGQATRRGGIAKNPFDYYNQTRVFPTLREGMQHGVEYEENWPKVLGNYLTTGLRRRANENLVQTLITRAAQNNPDLLGENIRPLILKGEDIVQLGESGAGRFSNARRLNEVIPGIQFEHRDIYASDQLANVLGNIYSAQSPFGRLGPLGRLLDFNAMWKHNILSGSIFHLVNETRQLFATQGTRGFENAWKMVHDMSTPGGGRAFWADPANRTGAVQALRDGLTLNLAADRKMASAWYQRVVSGGINVAGGAVAGYGGASAAGMSDDDKRNWALAGALIGLGLSVPIPGLGSEARSITEHVSNALWDRYIPFMKYTTYQMYAPGFGGPEAAKFANNVFGGQNLLAMARHPLVQDIAKMSLLAPDWQEGWIRQVGSAAFDWHGPQGQMNRIYWRNAAIQSAFVLEGMNQALGGKWSWENDPDATLMVNMSRLYDLMGWKHYDTYGKPYTPYLDILGPYRAMLQPLIETGRAATVGLAQAAGIDPSHLPKEVTGSFGEIPEPDPGTAWKNFASTRMGLLPATAIELKTGKDFAGRNIDRPTDPWWQVAANRTNQALTHLLPTGESQIVQAGTRGDPFAIAVLGGVTGMRTMHEPDSYFRFQDQFVRDSGLSQEDWQARQAGDLSINAGVDKDIEAIQNGLVNNDGSAAKPGMSDMTGKQRRDAINQKLGDRRPTKQALESLIPQDATPEERQRLQGQIDWLTKKQIVAGTDAPADITGRPDLDTNELFRLAWNRYPDQIAQIQGTQPRPTDLGQSISQNLLPHLLPSKDPTKALADLRSRWVTDTAAQWDVDPAALQDVIKAKLLGEDLPPLPGITSAELDSMSKQYQRMSEGEGGDSLAATEVVRKRQEWVAEQAAQHGVDPAALQDRIKLRTMPMGDQSPGALTVSHARTAMADSRTAAFSNPDGTPMGSPSEWRDWNRQLADNQDKYDKQSGIYVTHLPNGKVIPNDKLNGYDAGLKQANADRMKDILNGPYADEYERLYGKGSAMTDAQWAQYQAGVLPNEWHDPGGPVPPEEAIQRHKALLIWSALTKQERIDYSDPKKWNQQMTWIGTDWQHGGKTMKVNTTTLTEYVKYINQWQDAHWKDQGLGAQDAPAATP